MNKTTPIPDFVLPKYTEQACTIERALQEHEKGTQLESGFSPYALFYFNLVDKTVQMQKAVAGKGTPLHLVKAHAELSEKLRFLGARVTKAFAQVAPSELQDALRQDNAELAYNILKTKDLLTKALPNGEMPISFAIRCGSRRVVERLFKELPIDTSTRDHQKLTSIDHAILTKDRKMIALVLGAAIGKQDIPESALLSPIQSTDLQTMGAELQTLRYVPIPNLPPLCQAAYLGESAKLNDLIANGADIHAPSGASGLTPLHYAALGGQKAILEQLLKKGAKADRLAINGKSPLHLAAMNGHVECVKLLLSRAETQVNLADAQGKTALHYAMVLENLATARALVQNGGNPLIATMTTTPFAILMHMAEGRSKQRDPLQFQLSTILTSAAYGSAIGFNYAAERFLPVKGSAAHPCLQPDSCTQDEMNTQAAFNAKARIERILSTSSIPTQNALIAHELGELASGAPVIWNAPGRSLIGTVAGAVIWGGLYSQFAPVRMGLQAWQLYQIGKTALQGVAMSWKNRHLETIRPLCHVALHAFNTVSAAAGLVWTLKTKASAAYDARWAKVREEVYMHRTLNSEMGRKAWEEEMSAEQADFDNLSDQDKKYYIANFINKLNSQPQQAGNNTNCPAHDASSCAREPTADMRKDCELYLKAPEILDLTGPGDASCNKNWKKLSLQCHPDKNPVGCKYTQLEINQAHTILQEFGCCKK